MKVLVTGGAGFGGSYAVERLLSKGYDVTVLDIIPKSNARNLRDVSDQIKYTWGSILDVTSLENYDIIIHFAAQPDAPFSYVAPIHTWETNVIGTLRMLEALKHNSNVKRFVFMGSGTIYGKPSYVPIDEKHPLNPTNPYSASKAAADLLCQTYYKCYGLPIVVQRSGFVFGPRMRSEMFLSAFVRKVLNKEKSIELESAAVTRDFCYVDNNIDGIEMILEAEEMKVKGEIFNIATGKETTIFNAAKKCLEILKSNAEIVPRPPRPGEEGVRQLLSIQKAEKMLQYKPRISFEEGMKLTVKWLRDEYTGTNY